MRRASFFLVIPALMGVLWACGPAQTPEAQGPESEPAGERSAPASGDFEVCPTGDPSTQPCAAGCSWDEKYKQCGRDRGVIIEYAGSDAGRDGG